MATTKRFSTALRPKSMGKRKRAGAERAWIVKQTYNPCRRGLVIHSAIQMDIDSFATVEQPRLGADVRVFARPMARERDRAVKEMDL